MNTKISIHVNSNHSREFVYEYINKAYEQFEYVVKNFSRFDPKSELSVLNSSSNKWTKVSDELFDLISFALDVSDKTNGIFDPTVIDILEKYGYDKDYNFSKLDDPEIKKRIDDLIRTRPNYKAVELNAKRKKVKLVDNQGIDLGAIGKGYAIDLAYDVLEKKFKNFFINAGGDIRVKGVNTIDKPWKIKLEYRDKKGTAETLGFAE
ncbi:FAD:protein FMN transferase, partial [Candidatus Dojkabacteria bacterium]|nr:FAD:protein FMN transferase [Candidatus Dojkabacteria bacterium]